MTHSRLRGANKSAQKTTYAIRVKRSMWVFDIYVFFAVRVYSFVCFVAIYWGQSIFHDTKTFLAVITLHDYLTGTKSTIDFKVKQVHTKTHLYNLSPRNYNSFW